MKAKPHAKTVRAGIRASVPEGKLRKARIVLSDEGFHGGGIGGYTRYERETGNSDVVQIGAPIGDHAEGITIRGHETRHATRHKLGRKKPMTENAAAASQIVDDINIETDPIPHVRSERAYRRAHLTTAMRQLRTMVNIDRRVHKGLQPNTVGVRNAQLLTAVRAIAMLKHYGLTPTYPYDRFLPVEQRLTDAALKKIQDIIGRKTMNALNRIIEMAKRRRGRNRAIGMLEALMETMPTPEMEEREEEEHRREGDILAPVTEGDSDPMDGKMTIRNLIPKTIPCSKEKQITRRPAPDGVIINAGRYVNAIVNGDGTGLFSRRVRQKAGGTILIDASGSMHANSHNLTALCELCPTATVAYYSGSGKAKGELCVYALNGKRYPKELPQNSIHGGNAVDLPAIKWMMRLPKPWTLISDLCFCGGVLGSEAVAKALVERAVQRGELTVHRSLDEAYEAFGGKGELRNA